MYTVRIFIKCTHVCAAQTTYLFFIKLLILYFQRCIVMRQFHFSHEQVKHDYSLPRAYAVICGRFNITVNRDYLHAQNQGKLDNVCLKQFLSIFKSTIKPDFPSLAGEIAEARPDVNIKAAAFTVSERSNNTQSIKRRVSKLHTCI